MAHTESDHGAGSPAPRTPERYSSSRSRRRDDRDADEVASTSTTSLSPLPSPSMSSLHMSPLSPLRRDFSLQVIPSSFMSPSRSPSPPQFENNHHEEDKNLRDDEDGENDEDITQHTKDILVKRLNDLAKSLSQQHHVKDQEINILQAKVDELENVLQIPSNPSRAKTRRRTRHPNNSSPPTGRADGDGYESDISDEASRPVDVSLSDVFSISSPAPESPSPKPRPGQEGNKKEKSHASKLTVAQAEQVIEEAQNIYKDLETVISNLRDRQEETEHIHALLITRLERAAQRIIYLEDQLENLQSERNEGETEMLNLQIQLKAIEVRCLSYVPKDAERDLQDSIDAWKMEFSALKRRRAKKKELQQSSPMSPSTPRRRRLDLD